ncbi:Tctex-1 [Lojkania enalia]|uniref:Tctex-1 n=1 Tax=Lojkania enalia TaxID=147567 RepID=A0A9P4N9T2_9PLEO|nr:Tctex-1 [Didymosphaeria enalia]
MASSVNFPVPTDELQTIAEGACETALGSATQYDHSSVAEWNSKIINNILQSLIEKTKTETGDSAPFKFIVNSTIIQHLTSPSESASGGRRGMHSAVGAYWNNEKDGTWSFKWAGADAKGMDIVVSITWIGM